MSRYEHEQLVYATECLTRISALRLYGTAPHMACVLSFPIEGLKTDDIGVGLDREGIAARGSPSCAADPAPIRAGDDGASVRPATPTTTLPCHLRVRGWRTQ
jgi:cysteine desulfurase/selenocysteine lyase